MEIQNCISKLILFLIILSSCSSSNKQIEDKFRECKKNFPNVDYIIIVNFSIPSGKNRFFLYDNNGKLLLETLCEHGNGKGSTKQIPKFSNQIESHCSSLGYYAVENYNIMSKTKLPSFILNGVSSTNNNCKKRQILIHPYYDVPPFEIYPFYLNMSYGCFVINSIKFKKLSNIIINKKVILYSYK